MKQVMQHKLLATAVIAGLLASAPAMAITSVEANAGPQFNFVNPGARSLGMAGAFIGLADDSTAAYTNPAGLGQLSRKEFSAEVRYTEFSTRSVRNGRLIGAPSGQGRDTLAGLHTQSDTEGVANLSFLSFAFPLSHGTLAVYRHELANFEANFASEGPFIQSFETVGNVTNVSRVPPSINDIDLQIANYGFAGSWRVNDKFMLGGSVNFYQFDFDTLTRRYSLDANGDGVTTIAERTTTLDYSDAALVDRLIQSGDDNAFGFNVGLLWLPNDKWSVGAVYRKGPTFDYDIHSDINRNQFTFDGETEFAVPDVWGLGIGYRPTDAWRISLDVARVTYSDHSDEVVEQATTGDVPYLKLDDTTEVRLGAEWTAINAARPYSLRFGVWREPAHQLHFVGEPTPYTGTPLTVDQNRRNTKAALFIEGDDAWHGSLGYGVVFDKFQVDAALDLSQRVDTLSVSMVYFFK
jgi:long-subunit fatty acid transport protein